MSRDSFPESDALPDATPWQRQFWPWFLIALPATAVVAGMVTLSIAIDNADHLVVDDWYREGRAINRHIEQDRQARRLGIVAHLDPPGGGVRLTLESGIPLPWPEQLALTLRHPTLAERDRRFLLRHQGGGRYLLPGEPLPGGDWHLGIEADGWRLGGRRTLGGHGAVLGSEGP